MVRLVAVTLVMLVIGVAAGIMGYNHLLEIKSRVERAETYLREAQTDLRVLLEEKDFSRISQARRRFSETRGELALVNAKINAFGPVYTVAEALPGVGTQIEAATRLMLAVPYVAEAGEEACLAAENLIEATTKNDGEEITQAVFDVAPAVTAHLTRSLWAIERAEEQYRGISRERLHPSLERAVSELDIQIPKQRALLRSSLDLMRALPRIMGEDGEKTYLLLVQDSGEIRPTGGFIGNYGIIRFRDGKKVETFFNDVYRLDWPYYYAGKAPPPVAMFARYLPEATFWALRDSNLWPDFDRSAKQAAWFAIQEGAAERIDGVIGVTHDIVEPVMRVVGPIDIPEYGETVDATNVLEKIRYYQTAGPSLEQRKVLGVEAASNRKFFTSLVLKKVIERLDDLDVDGMVRLADAMQDSISTKALQVYFDDPELQDFARAYDVAGTMKEASGDYLWVIDMNLSAAKDNMYVKQSVSYTVTLDPTGGATGELQLLYDYSTPGKLYTGTVMFPYYANYLRVYVPDGSKLLHELGTDEPVETFNEVGRTVFGTFVKVPPQGVKEVRLRYSLPPNVWSPMDQTRYELLAQKQAGKNLRSFDVTVEIPPGFSARDPGPFVSADDTLHYQSELISDTRLVTDLAKK